MLFRRVCVLSHASAAHSTSGRKMTTTRHLKHLHPTCVAFVATHCGLPPHTLWGLITAVTRWKRWWSFPVATRACPCVDVDSGVPMHLPPFHSVCFTAGIMNSACAVGPLLARRTRARFVQRRWSSATSRGNPRGRTRCVCWLCAKCNSLDCCSRYLCGAVNGLELGTVLCSIFS